MNKELKFKLTIENGDFDRAVETMQQKLARLSKITNQPAPQTGGNDQNLMSKAGMEAFFKAQQTARATNDREVQKQFKEHTRLAKDYAKEEQAVNKLLAERDKLNKSAIKDSKEILAINEKLAASQSALSRHPGSPSYQGPRGPGGGGPSNQGPGAPPPSAPTSGSGGGGFLGGMNAMAGMRNLKMVAAAVGKAFGTVAGFMEQQASLDLTRAASIGSATQSTIGAQLEQLSRGDIVQGAAWQKERARAAQYAGSKLETNRQTDFMNAAGGMSSLLFGGGGPGGDRSATQMTEMLSKAFSNVFSVGGLVSNDISRTFDAAATRFHQTHEAQLSATFGEDYLNMVEAQKKSNPLKNLATQFLQDRSSADLQSERMLGLGDRGFYGAGGFMQQANQAGFTGDMRMESARQMQAAGGSTRAMRGGASLTALQAGRAYDMTNAGGVMGAISGGAGSSEASERIFKQILTEAVKNGLDGADSVEELRRFSQQTAEVVSKTGANTGGDAQRIIENFSRFQAGGATTIREQEGAKSAYQEYQGFSAETSGRGGAMQFAAMMKHGLGKIGPEAMGSFMEMPAEDITTTNSRVIATAARFKMSPEDLVEKLLAAKQEKADTEIGFNPKNRQTLKDAGVTGTLSFEQLRALPENVQKAYYESEVKSAGKSQYESSQKAAAVARGIRTGASEGGSFGPLTADQQIAQDLQDAKLRQGKPGERAGDDVNAAAGVAAQVFLENFRDFKNEITPTGAALDELTRKLTLLAAAAAGVPDKDKAAVLQNAAKQLYTPKQPQAAKPSSDVGGVGRIFGTGN